MNIPISVFSLENTLFFKQLNLKKFFIIHIELFKKECYNLNMNIIVYIM